jgi:hypothetical protein
MSKYPPQHSVLKDPQSVFFPQSEKIPLFNRNHQYRVQVPAVAISSIFLSGQCKTHCTCLDNRETPWCHAWTKRILMPSRLCLYPFFDMMSQTFMPEKESHMVPRSQSISIHSWQKEVMKGGEYFTSHCIIKAYCHVPEIASYNSRYLPPSKWNFCWVRYNHVTK